MEVPCSKLTVFFEDPFWVGLYEREQEGRYEVCRIVFGAEPKDCEVYALVLRHWPHLRFSPPITAERRTEPRLSPKRMQRAIARQLQEPASGTKAQQALAAQREQNKLARREQTRERREAEQERRFALRQRKRREKHKGH